MRASIVVPELAKHDMVLRIMDQQTAESRPMRLIQQLRPQIQLFDRGCVPDDELSPVLVAIDREAESESDQEPKQGVDRRDHIAFLRLGKLTPATTRSREPAD